MSPEEATFIEAMADAPDDPGPRIVFADWLLERGDPRGDYFRLHHEVRHGKPSSLAAKRAAKVVKRELARVTQGYRGAFAPDGLLAYVDVTFKDLFEDAPRLFSLGPIHLVRLGEASHQVARLAKLPQLRWILGLAVGAAHATEADARLLAASPDVRRLRTLDIQHNALGASGAAMLVDALPALTDLDVSHTALANDIAWLVPVMPRLRMLGIAGNNLDIESVQRLLAAAGDLASLDLSDNELGRSGARAIAAASHLGHLRSLVLDRTDLHDDGLHALVHAPHLARLEHLSVRSNFLGPASANILELPGTFPKLRTLALEGNPRIPAQRLHQVLAQFKRR